MLYYVSQLLKDLKKDFKKNEKKQKTKTNDQCWTRLLKLMSRILGMQDAKE